MLKIIVLVLLACAFTTPALAQNLEGDWTGQMNGSFKVRIHFDKAGSGFSGKLINPSGNETVLDQITCDGTQIHFSAAATLRFAPACIS